MNKVSYRADHKKQSGLRKYYEKKITKLYLHSYFIYIFISFIA